MTEQDIAKSRAICNAATPGPWWARGDGPAVVLAVERNYSMDGGCDDYEVPVADASPFDAVFIAHARTALPAALDEIERLREVIRNAARKHMDAELLSARHSPTEGDDAV